MKVIVMICYARSGGTLLNKCLASFPQVVMLSEINPLGGGWGEKGIDSYTTVKAQAKEWYEIEIESDDFIKSVIELKKACNKYSKSLIIRDWTYVNFSPCKENNYTPPNKLLILEQLNKNFELVSFALVRDSIDIWISRGLPPITDFFSQYLNYIKELLENRVTIIKYEDLCNNPTNIIKDICHMTNLNYSDEWMGFQNYLNVNGDVQLKSGSRNYRKENIYLLPRKLLDKNTILQLSRCEEMITVNSLLGYSSSYYSRELEKKIVKKIKKFLLN